MNATGKTIVSTEWLQENLASPVVRIIDASWYLPTECRDARGEYERCHIPGAVFFDIDEVSDKTIDLPHMVPPAEAFARAAAALGVGDDDTVIVYDSAGLFSAARVWWLFRLMGKTNVAVLDGGLPKWRAEGRVVESDAPLVKQSAMSASRIENWVKRIEDVAQASGARDAQIVDARPPARFRGEAPEPRAGLRGGHIPGSKNIYYKDVLRSDGTLKSVDEIREVISNAGVDLSSPIITSCGSGVTAAVLSLALEHVGHRDHALYDGSWAEWGMRGDYDVEVG